MTLFERALKAIHEGYLIAYPTEGVYGLGCDPTNPHAIQSLLNLKKRTQAKGLVIVSDRLDRVFPWIQPLSPLMVNRVLPTWPGPTTWLLPATKTVTPLLRGDSGALAVRITAHPLTRRLCEQARTALVSTSANISGQQPYTKAEDVKTALGHGLHFVLPGPLGFLSGPTEIRDGLTGQRIRPLVPDYHRYRI